MHFYDYNAVYNSLSAALTKYNIDRFVLFFVAD